MQTVTTIGLDIAKSVFQVHAVDAAGKVIIRRQLKRRYVLAFFEKLPPCPRSWRITSGKPCSPLCRSLVSDWATSMACLPRRLRTIHISPVRLRSRPSRSSQC